MLEPLNIFEPSLRPRFVPAWWTWSSSTTSSSQPTTQRCSKFTCQKILVHKDDSTSFPKVMSGFRLLTLFMVLIPTFKHMGNVSKWGVLYSPESNHFGTTKGHFILKHAHSSNHNNHTRKSHRLFALDSNNIFSLSAPARPRRLAIKELCSQFLGRSPCLHGSGWFPQSKWITHLSLQLGGTKMTTSKWISGRGGGSNHSKSFKLFLLSSLLGSSLLDL